MNSLNQHTFLLIPEVICTVTGSAGKLRSWCGVGQGECDTVVGQGMVGNRCREGTRTLWLRSVKEEDVMTNYPIPNGSKGLSFHFFFLPPLPYVPLLKGTRKAGTRVRLHILGELGFDKLGWHAKHYLSLWWPNSKGIPYKRNLLGYNLLLSWEFPITSNQ